MKGIIFKPQSIQAIIEGRKTQTRRVVKFRTPKHNPKSSDSMGGIYSMGDTQRELEAIQKGIIKPHISLARYRVGETVYIKEAYCADCIEGDKRLGSRPCYKLGREDNPASDFCEHWHSPLMMPMRFARYFITITDVRAERVQEITLGGLRAEGVIAPVHCSLNEAMDICAKSFKQFSELWNSINKDYPFESNPWVWVYTFRLKGEK